MKKREISELKNLKINEMEKRLTEMRKKMLEVQVKIVVGKEKNVRLAKNLRKDIAQVKTLVCEKRREEKK